MITIEPAPHGLGWRVRENGRVTCAYHEPRCTPHMREHRERCYAPVLPYHAQILHAELAEEELQTLQEYPKFVIIEEGGGS